MVLEPTPSVDRWHQLVEYLDFHVIVRVESLDGAIFVFTDTTLIAMMFASEER